MATGSSSLFYSEKLGFGVAGWYRRDCLTRTGWTGWTDRMDSMGQGWDVGTNSIRARSGYLKFSIEVSQVGK